MKTLFAIGASKWSGVSKLIEEAGEVLQVAGKLMATYGETTHWEGSNLGERLADELGDLLAAIDFVLMHRTGLCGATGEKAILADNVDFVLPGYKACELCLVQQEKERKHGKSEW